MIFSPKIVHKTPYLVILFAVGLFIFRFMISGDVIYWGIPTLQFIPWRWEAFQQLSEGIIPLWNPYNGMGSPLLANYQLALFYPPSWILYIFAWIGGLPWMVWGHTLLVFLHLVWAGWGMVKLSKALDIPILGQSIAGLAYALGGYLAARTAFFSIIWCAAWLPWLAYVLECNIVRRENTPWRQWFSLNIFGPLLIILSMQLLSGHAQLTAYSIQWVFAWVLWRSLFHRRFKVLLTNISRIFITLLTAVFISAIQLLPTLEYLLESSRSSSVEFDTAISYSFWPWKLITLISPNFFGNPGLGNYWGYGNYWEDGIYLGVLPLCLAVIAIFIKNSPDAGNDLNIGNQQKTFLFLSVLLSFLLALGKNTQFFPFLYDHIPTFDMFNAPVRYLVIAAISISLLAGYGVVSWQRPVGRAMYWMRLATAGGAAMTLGAVLAANLFHDIEHSFINSLIITGVFLMVCGFLTIFKPVERIRYRNIVWSVIVCVFLMVDLLVSHWNLVPVVDLKSFEQASFKRISKFNVDQPRHFLHIDQEYLIKFQRFLRFEDYRPIEKIDGLFAIPVPNSNLLGNISMVNNFDPLVPSRYAEWMTILGRQDTNDLKSLLKIMNVSLWLQLELHDPSGIFRKQIKPSGLYQWYSCAVRVSSDDGGLDATLSSITDSHGLNRHIVLYDDSGINGARTDCYKESKPFVKLLEHTPSIRTLKLDSEHPGWLMVSEMDYPGWRAFINGKRAEIFTANYLFYAIFIPPGTHIVQFKYHPPSFTIGLIISLVTLIILAVLLVIIFREIKST